LPACAQGKSAASAASRANPARAGRDYYGSFQLVASDLADLYANESYNPCAQFRRKWQTPKSVAKRAAELHDVSGRSKAANVRELRKFVRGKWEQCRARGKAVATCAQQTRAFIAERYRVFLSKERMFQVSDGEVEEWVDAKIAELSGLLVAEDDKDAVAVAKEEEEN
jgi:hypothetical protein